MFDDKEFIKKIVLILIFFICLVILYYVVSPYQNCVRFVTSSESYNKDKYDEYIGSCIQRKSW